LVQGNGRWRLVSMIILHRVSPGISEAALGRFLAKAKRAAGVRGSINVLVSGNRELRSLNKRFRGKDQPTDVLSFPPEFAAGDFSGDVAISLEIARKNARLLKHTVAKELKILVLHGVLHLAGHDHESDHGEMAQLEERLRKQLHLPTALIERTANGASGRKPERTAKERSLGSRRRRTR
jgi:probable rRNA maturation factor